MAGDTPTVRELRREDLQNGFLASLDSLRQSSSMDAAKAERIFEGIDADPNHIIAVAELGGRVVGTATLLIEPKFIHDGGLVGHVEDAAVDRGFQGIGIGRKILEYLLERARERGCYKTITNCDDKIRGFNEKVGFKMAAHAMRFDHQPQGGG